MRRWLAVACLIGLVAAAAASWSAWTHPLVTDPDQHFAISVAPFLVWALLFILLAVFTGRNTTHRPPGLAAQRRAAINFLAEAGLRGRHARYSVPFYLVAGPPGSGKSSILEDTEQRFSASAEIGETVWRVGRDAVFIESSAGAIDGQLSAVADLLRAVRSKLPLNGVVLVVSPADLTLADPTEQRFMAQSVAKALRELDETLNSRAPLYLLLSKIDLVPGFKEFFDRYETDERIQPWGFTLSDDEDLGTPREAEIDKGFGDIVEAMRLRHIEWLSREGDPVRNAHLQGFSAQISALRQTIAPILELLLADRSRPERDRYLRGVFLTSARQEALSIDALLPELSRRFAMPRSGTMPPDLGLDEGDQGYFIKGTLEKVIIPEAGLIMRGKRHGAAWFLLWTGFTALLVAGIWGGYRLLGFFDKEVSAASRLSDSASRVPALANPARLSDLPKVLAEIRRLKEMKASFTADAPEDILPFLEGPSERVKLAAAIDDVIDAYRSQALAPQIAALYEATLVDMTADAETLKSRLAALDAGGRISPARLREWLERIGPRVAPDDMDLLLSEGVTAFQSAGVSVGQPYIDAARRIIAYKDSIS